jgi:hypothetical protein
MSMENHPQNPAPCILVSEGGNILERQKGLWSTEAKEWGIVLRVHGIGVVIAVS